MEKFEKDGLDRYLDHNEAFLIKKLQNEVFAGKNSDQTQSFFYEASSYLVLKS